jgi:hypothetical protein
VTTVLALRREPPQKCEPPTCRETMKGKSPADAASPPTMLTLEVPASTGGMAGAAATVAARAAVANDLIPIVWLPGVT